MSSDGFEFDDAPTHDDEYNLDDDDDPEATAARRAEWEEFRFLADEFKAAVVAVDEAQSYLGGGYLAMATIIAKAKHRYEHLYPETRPGKWARGTAPRVQGFVAAFALASGCSKSTVQKYQRLARIEPEMLHWLSGKDEITSNLGILFALASRKADELAALREAYDEGGGLKAFKDLLYAAIPKSGTDSTVEPDDPWQQLVRLADSVDEQGRWHDIIDTMSTLPLANKQELDALRAGTEGELVIVRLPGAAMLSLRDRMAKTGEHLSAIIAEAVAKIFG